MVSGEADGSPRSWSARAKPSRMAGPDHALLRTANCRTVFASWYLVDGLRSRKGSTMRLSVGIPVYNEEQVLPELLARLLPVLSSIGGGPHELVAVDDG